MTGPVAPHSPNSCTRTPPGTATLRTRPSTPSPVRYFCPPPPAQRQSEPRQACPSQLCPSQIVRFSFVRVSFVRVSLSESVCPSQLCPSQFVRVSLSKSALSESAPWSGPPRAVASHAPRPAACRISRAPSPVAAAGPGKARWKLPQHPPIRCLPATCVCVCVRARSFCACVCHFFFCVPGLPRGTVPSRSRAARCARRRSRAARRAAPSTPPAPAPPAPHYALPPPHAPAARSHRGAPQTRRPLHVRAT